MTDFQMELSMTASGAVGRNMGTVFSRIQMVQFMMV